MSIGLFNNDSSFFYVAYDKKVEAKDVTTLLSENVISFNIEEELGKIISGSITFYDPDWTIAKILRTGIKLKISWGYKKFEESPAMLYQKSTGTNPLEMKGSIERRGFEAFIMNGSGSATENGAKIFVCNFTGMEYLQQGKNKYYDSGTKESVVSDIMYDLGIKAQYINFNTQYDSLTVNTAVKQWTPPFLFLSNLAFEWGAVFKTGVSAKGQKIGCFARYGSPQMLLYSKEQAQAVSGNLVEVSYQGDVSKTVAGVKAYTWQCNLTGSGDNVQVLLVNGKPQFIRQNAKDETAEVWILNDDAVKDFVKKGIAKGDMINRLKLIMEKDVFDDEAKKFFKKETVRTAPQGIGYSLNLQMIGNPLFTAPCQIVFKKGFPAITQSKGTSFWVKKVSHKIDRSGYMMSIDVADAYTLSGGSLLGMQSRV